MAQKIKELIENAVSTAKQAVQGVVDWGADQISANSKLRPEQVRAIEEYRKEKYLQNKQTDTAMKRALGAIGVEVFRAYLPQISQCYLPVAWERERYNHAERVVFFDITKWVIDTSEKDVDKLTNLYQTLMGEPCSIALIYTRRSDDCRVTMAVANQSDKEDPTEVESFYERLCAAVRGNFPGAEWQEKMAGIPEVLLQYKSPTTVGEGTGKIQDYTIAAVSNLATEKSENFISQSIEKLLDGIVPQKSEDGEPEEYSIVLLAQPVQGADIETEKNRLYELYSVLSPFATWQISQSSNDSLSETAAANGGASAGIHVGQSFGGNFGLQYARSAATAQTVGVSEGSTFTRTNYTVKHTLELLEEQVKRLEQCSALGMWSFAAYVISQDYKTADNVSRMYLSLTQGERSYMERAAINLWRDDQAQELMPWLQAMQHPAFGLSMELEEEWLSYPVQVSAATLLSGRELARALNFPRGSVSGLPVFECVPFGREAITYASHGDNGDSITLGKAYHMRKEETADIGLSKKDLIAHTFITGSTGAGKSNVIYTMLDKLCLSPQKKDAPKFLIIESAKGEYKEVLGGYKGVQVYGTNPRKAKLLRLNPFYFPEDTHVLEHIDRLVEIFNACWPMYAAMPAVLKAAVETAYTSCGWSLNQSAYFPNPKKPAYPTFIDVMNALPVVVDTKGFSKDTQGDYKGALLTRLESLTNGINGQVFCAEAGLSDEDLFEKNVIVDLSRVGSSETKALLMGILILKLQEHRMEQREKGKIPLNSTLRHITVLEEAHNLLRRTSTGQNQESSNLQGKSVEMITNAIAEMRTYGEGFIIADQAPGLLDMAAIRNTNTKIILRLPDEGDRRLVGKAAGLNDDQIVELSRLDTGVAAVYQNHWIEPVLCKVDRFSKPQPYKSPKTTANALEIPVNDTFFQSLLDPAKDMRPAGGDVDLERLRGWIRKLDTGTEIKRLLLRATQGEKLSEREAQRAIYCAVKGKELLEQGRRMLDVRQRDEFIRRRICETLSVSEAVAPQVHKALYGYLASCGIQLENPIKKGGVK